MALRHPFPEAILPDLRQKAEPEKAPPLMRKPYDVKFRPGSDIAGLSEEMVGHKCVRVSATLGAGKSTRLPAALSKVRNTAVIHVVPSRLLAVSLYDYLSSQKSDVEYKLSLSPDDGLGKVGVTITYAANMMCILLQKGMTDTVKPFGDCLLYLDECHESDSFTYTLGKLSHVVTGVDCVMFASATHSAERMPMREAEGEVESRLFPKEDKPTTWDPLHAGRPWSVSEMAGNCLMFVDSEKVARDLSAKYEQAGATAYRLTAKMPVAAFRQAMKAMKDPKSGVVVLIADYSFRSGFTLDVQDIIDSCIVSYSVVDNGKFEIRCRFAYELERNQAAGRGGRTAGSACVTHAPDVPVERAICNLEGVEMDAAAVMFRYLGYAPPVELRNTLMAKGNVPVDFASAANDVRPLALLAADQLYSLVAPVASTGSVSAANSPTVTEVLGDYAMPTPPLSPTDFFADAVGEEERVVQRVQLDGLGFLHELQQMSGTGNTVVPGQYYMVPGLPDRNVVTRLYGEDWRSAAKEILANDFMTHGYDRADRHEIVALLLNVYNKSLTVKCGLETMLQAHESLTALATKFPQQVHNWSELVGTTLRESESHVNMLAEALQRLRTEGMRFVCIDANVRGETMVAQQWASKLHGAIQSLRGNVEPEKYLEYIQGAIEEGPDMPDAHHESLEIDKDGKRERAVIRVKPAKVGRKRMIDLTAAAGAGAAWNKRDFKIMLATYLESAGVDIHAVRSLRLQHTRVSGEEVLQEIRDEPEFMRREKSRFELTYSTESGKSGARKMLRSSRSGR